MGARLGLTLGLEGAPLGDSIALCREAESWGYTDVWSAEVGGADGLAALAAAAPQTEGLRLGTAILPVFTRPPALLAMGAATVQHLSGGRFVLGLGTSSDVIVENWMGTGFDRPLTRMREYVAVLREILNGKKTSFEGETVRSQGFRLQMDPGSPIPIYLAALGPKACRLAGQVADGVIFFLKTPDGVRQAMEWVREGAAEAGRDASDLDVVIRLSTAVDEDAETLRYASRRATTAYAAVGVYNKSLELQGFADEAKDINAKWKAGDRAGAVESFTDEMLDGLMVFGDEAECRRRLDEFREAGVKTPVLLPISVAGDPEERSQRVRSAVRALAPRS